MNANKIVMNTPEGKKVLIDLTEDNVTEDVVPEGITFHGADGAEKTGTFTLAPEMSEQDSLISQIQQALQGKAAGGGGGTDTRLKELTEGTLTEIDDNTITTTRAYAFYGARSLERVNLPNATSLGSYSFNSCESLVSINLPNVTSAIPTYCFSGCSALMHVNAPNATGANNYSFQDCEGLEKVELGHATTVGSYAFRRSGVTALIIRNTTSKLTNLSSTNAFTGCPIEDGTGYIYFYRQYVEDYKAKTGWTAYADQIRAIEDYPEICGGA